MIAGRDRTFQRQHLKHILANAGTETLQCRQVHLREILTARGISHVLVSTRDLFWFTPFDPERRLRQWYGRFEAGHAGYLELIATNEDSALYRVKR